MMFSLSHNNLGQTLVDRAVVRVINQLDHVIFREKFILEIGGTANFDRYSTNVLSRSKFTWVGETDKHSYDIISDPETSLNGDHLFDICFIEFIENPINLINKALKYCECVIVKHKKEEPFVAELLTTFGATIVHHGFEGDVGVFVLSSLHQFLLRDVLQPQIGVYVICKNEEKFIERMYRSIEDADFISIIDTGSSDSTFSKLVELIQHRTELHGHEEELEFTIVNGLIIGASDGAMQVKRAWIDPWRFDDAKNLALSMLPENIDVCVSIDADEILEPGWKSSLINQASYDLQNFGRVSDRYNHRFSTIWNWQLVDRGIEQPTFTEHWHERIHARNGYRWKLPVHEVLVKSDGSEERVIWLHDLRISQKPDIMKCRASYHPLLKIAIAEDPTRWRLWSFYANELITVKSYKEAINAIEEAKKLKDADIAYLSYQASQIYQILGETTKAIKELSLAVACSTEREYLVWLAKLYRECGKKREALNAILLAKDIESRSYGYIYDPRCWGLEFDELIEQLDAECN